MPNCAAAAAVATVTAGWKRSMVEEGLAPLTPPLPPPPCTWKGPAAATGRD